jgi:acetolactate synthase-1/2/3 large subunit
MAKTETLATGAEILLQTLKSNGVDTIFAITGAGNLAIIDAIARDGEVKLIYSHHEQAAAMEAQGYSRITGKLGVVLVTTGAGTSNVVTGVLSAHLDSIPILVISGNESSFHCANPIQLRAYGVQGFDSCAVLAPISKKSCRVMDVEDISKTVQELIYVALENRQGPTHFDFPMDLQRTKIDSSESTSYKHLESKLHPSGETALDKLVEKISNSKSPIIYFGNGVRKQPSLELAKSLIDKTGIPFFVSWSAIDLFPESYSQNIGRVGIYGDRHANILLQKSDLIIAIGTRLAIPQIGYDRLDFGRKAEKWIIDIDPSETSKFDGLGWNTLNLSASLVLEHLNKSKLPALNILEWKTECTRIKNIFPRRKQLGPQPSDSRVHIHSGDVIEFLNQNLAEDAMVATDVGAALLTGHFMYEQKGNRRFFTSQGLGEMGFGLPAAIGAHFSDISKQIVCLNTDGAIMFNLQELQLVKEHKIPLKLFIFNNSGYSMIKVSQDNLFEGRLSGSTIESGISFPDFEHVALTFGFSHTLIKCMDDLEKILDPLASQNAELIEIMMDPDQKYFPRLATSKLEDGTLVSPPLEDLDPKIELSLLEELLGYKAHENSYKSRGL